MTERQDNDLVRDTLDGRTDAFGVLVERYQKVIFNVAYRMSRDYDEAQDIAQAAFLKAYQNLKRFNPDYKFFSWLYRIAVNESLNRVQSRKKLAELSPAMKSGGDGPDTSYEKSELGEKVQDALMNMEPGHRALIIMRHFRDCSYREIAGVLDIPEKKVKSRLFTARQLLRTALVARGVLADE
jgi:RNA polymerase sigma-70 factor (ECF subfamily)